MKKKLYGAIFRRIGWSMRGEENLKTTKCVIIVVPHTSWHDFYIGVLARGISGLSMHFVAKRELFIFPFGSYFRWMGGTPLNRAKNEGKVEAIARIIQEKEVFRLAIAPEGTRKKVKKWKTGFYYIALAAEVPIVPVAFDYKQKQVRAYPPFHPTGNMDADLHYLYRLYEGVEGKCEAASFTYSEDPFEGV